MAACDYAQCQECGGKAFYDANLHYDNDTPPMPDGTPLPEGTGFMFVLCDRCCDEMRAGELLEALKPHVTPKEQTP